MSTSADSAAVEQKAPPPASNVVGYNSVSQGAAGGAAGDADPTQKILLDMQKQLQRFAEQNQLLHEQMRAMQLQAGQSAIRSVADTLRIPPTSNVKATSTSAASRSKSAARRSILSTPKPAAKSSAGETDEEDDEAEDTQVGALGMTFNQILQAMKGLVEPFYADESKDKQRTVLHFVENVETVMGNFLASPKSPYRLVLVQSLMRDDALHWFNSKLQELMDQARKDGRDLVKRPINWDDDMRRLVIVTFTPANNIELWLAKLSALRLGAEKTQTPIELENQFDTIARHVFPAAAVGGDNDRDDMLLASKYQEIIRRSDMHLFELIVRLRTPTTLKEWKAALLKQWTAEQNIKNARAEQRSAATEAYRAGQQKGRGGYGKGDSKSQAVSVNALQEEEPGEGRAEGGTSTTEVKDGSQQLSAVAGSSQQGNRGGRGGRGGRGRGGGAGQKRQLTAEQRQRFIDGLCLECGEAGHIARNCPKVQAGQK